MSLAATAVPRPPPAAASQLQRWLDGLRALHARALKGGLAGPDRARYLDDRRRLLDGLLDEEARRLRPGQRRRAFYRLSRAVPVQLAGPAGRSSLALTQDFSAGGFSALVAPVPKVGDAFQATLKLPGGASVTASALVVATRPRAGAARVGFRFTGLSPSALEAIELVVADALLASLG